jgi:hypothetical protein
MTAARAEYRRRYNEEHQERRRELCGTPERRLLALWRTARARAAKAGVEFTISAADLGVPPMRCPLLGTEISYAWTGKRGPKDNSPSIDRVDPRLGYVPGNVWIICNRANRIKGDGTAREHLVIALAMANQVANVQGHGKRDLERALREAGCSISLSKRIAATGFTALREAAAEHQTTQH